MNTPRYLMQPGAERWFDARKFRRELGVGLMGAAGLYAAFLLIWAAR